MPEDTLSRIRAVSLFLRGLARVGLIGLGLLALVTVAKTGWLLSLLEADGPELVTVTGATTLALQAVVLILLLPPAYTLLQVRHLFTHFAEGRIFDPAPALAIRRTGIGMLAMVAGGILAKPLVTVLLTMGNPPGQRQVSVAVSADTYVLALFGGLMITLGWVLGEATRLSDENRQFV